VAVGVCNPLQWRNRPRFSRGSQAFDCGDGWTKRPSFFKEQALVKVVAAICQEKFMPVRAKERIFHYHRHAAGQFPLPTTEEWGEGKGEGIPISRQFDGTCPLPSPLPARASQGEGTGERR